MFLAWCAFVCLAVCGYGAPHALGQQQQSNPVERKVLNPITDTPNVNPLQQEQPIRPRMPVRPDDSAAGAQQQQQSLEQLDITSGKQTASGAEGARVVVHEGDVDARVGIYRLQSDKLTVYESLKTRRRRRQRVFDQGEAQRTGFARGV